MSGERLQRLMELLTGYDDGQHDQAMLLVASLGDAALKRALFERLITTDRPYTALRLIPVPKSIIRQAVQLYAPDRRIPQWRMWWMRFLAEPFLTPSLAAPLARLDLHTHLSDCAAAVIGTLPLGVDVPGSDLDIALQVPDIRRARPRLRALWGSLPGFSLTSGITQGVPALTVGFTLDGLSVEVFASTLPLMQQDGVAHFLIEAELLGLLGPAFRERVRALRASGLKTEPAFAAALQLPGDPYDALLRLQTFSDAAIATRWRSLQPGG